MTNITSMKGMKFKLKPLPRQPDPNDAIYKLENLLQLYNEDTMTHQVITSAIKEIKDLRYCMGEMDDIVDRLEIRIGRLNDEVEKLQHSRRLDNAYNDDGR